ncbi:GntR family transcriptional regulator [Aureimonas frigidaquae]|uniref:Transcriptional regulator n=1 Tax=Aureimonas frigidaquae TaxID=424757 RepID=A0A0P0Z3Q4_9HYPH|nr:GntR family transcriptional regulator [Aureimonas frigidaquae]BAT28554.1 transcriptional regulator [Aureimonas frigidaquae]
MNIALETHSSRPGRAKSSVAFDALKRDIMLGELPEGRALTELELARRFQCSQGTVREALLQLQDEGLVIRQGHRGTQVSACTEEEAVELFRIRRMIEIRGVRQAVRAGRRTLTSDLNMLLARMIDVAKTGDELSLAALDRDFHRRLFADADLPALDPILHRCLVHNHRFKISRTEASRRDLNQTALRHEPIIAAIAAGDAEGAAEALDHHIVTIVDFGPAIFPEAHS